MKFVYELVNEYEDGKGGIDGIGCGSIEYEPTTGELIEGLAEISFDRFYKSQFEGEFPSNHYQYIQSMKDFFWENDWMIDDLADTYEDELKDYFRDTAFDQCM